MTDFHDDAHDDAHAFAREHDHVEPLLAEYAFGTSEPRDRARVDAHLATCAACRATAAELADAVAGLERSVQHASPLEPRAGARESLLAAARRGPRTHPAAAHRHAPPRPARAPRRRSWIAAAVPTLACIVLALVLVDRQRDIASLERDLDTARGDQVPVLKGASIDDLDIGGPFGDTRAQVVLKRDAGIVTFRDVPAPPDGMEWRVSAVDEDDRLHALGSIPEARELAIVALDELDPDEVERIIVTTEADEPDDAPEVDELDLDAEAEATI